jgi:protein-tyrosine phosphatase
MHPYTEAALSRHGVDADEFTSRRLTEDVLDWADVVLTMTAQHRQEAVTLNPRALRKSFTLLEAEALLELVPPDQLEQAIASRDLADLFNRGRSLAGARFRRGDLDVVDPIDGPAALHLDVVDIIVGALSPLADVLDRGRVHDMTVRMYRLPPVPPPRRRR